MAKLNFMVVDDSTAIVKILTGMLESLGHRVIHSCKDGLTACATYKDYNPDIVTMDITMPYMNGIETTAKLTKDYPNAIILVITSHGQEEMVVDAIKAGAKGYILKPINKDKLETTLNKIIAKHFSQYVDNA